MGLDWQRLVGVEEPRRTGEVGELPGIMEEAGIERTGLLLYARSGEHYRRALEGGGDGRSQEELRREIKEEIKSLNRWGCGWRPGTLGSFLSSASMRAS